MAESVSINLAKAGIDFDLLKEARDSVAHTGKMTDRMRAYRPYPLLSAAQFGLQLLLLAKLGYSGLIVADKDGWKSNEPIKSFLTKEI